MSSISLDTTSAQILAQAKASYARSNPKSHERWLNASRAMPGGNTRSVLFFSPFPLCIERGEGSHLYDADGHRYVDLLGEYTAGIYGHSNEIIQSAITETLRSGIVLAAQTKVEGDLANLICERFDSIHLVRFTNSGSEANLMALTAAIAYTRRKKILVFANSYHGGLLSFAASGLSPVNVPYDFEVAPYNETTQVREIIRRVNDDLAAILVEPMLGAGGCIPAEPEFLRMLSAEASACGAVLIFDEIQTSRLSSGGRQKLLGIRPDLTTLGKYFGGGLPFGAFGGREDLMAQFDPRRPSYIPHAGTFNNNVLTMTAGYAGLSRILTAEVLEGLNRRGEALTQTLNGILRADTTDLYVTGLGSIMNFHCRGDRERASEIMQTLFFDLLGHGFYLAPRGMIALSLEVSDNQISDFIAAVRRVIDGRRELFSC